MNLNNNKITSLTGLENLPQLRHLNLNNNRITSITGFKKPPQLVYLNLSFNRITNIDSIKKFTSLRQLTLANNLVTDLKPLISLVEKNTKLNIVIKETYESGIDEINIANNPFTTPPLEIANRGSKAVLKYFSDLEKRGTDYLYEAKMLIVGQPRAGKTSLRYKLLNIKNELASEDKTTRGIDIERLNFDITDIEGKKRKFYYNVWDFGGQQIYQTTHQFFLTQRSLYVLVIDTGKDSIGNDDNSINYWLQSVELLGGNSPMLIVKNERNERKITIDLGQKRGRFDFLKDDYTIDLNALIPGSQTFKSESHRAFKHLKDDIENELQHLPLVGLVMPKNWVQIRNELRELSTNTYFITKKDFIILCEKHQVMDYKWQMELSYIFHDLGIFLHFQDHLLLRDFIILQNTWATDAVFTVLDNVSVQNNKGRFTDIELPEIWKDKNYEPSVHNKLLALMMKFELCYLVDESKPNIYIIPELLDDSPPNGYQWQSKNDLPLQYRYDFMPKGILTRLIVRMHTHIALYDKQQVVWKTGVKIDGTHLDCLNTFAEITEAWDNKQLNIRVQGSFATVLMSKITHEVDSLNREYFRPIDWSEQTQKSKWYKMIPCICVACRDNAEKHFFDYRQLLKMKEFGVPAVRCEKEPYSEVSISVLIDGVFSTSTGNRIFSVEKLKKIKLFVSYSSRDRTLRNLIMSGLKANLAHRNFEYEIWADSEIDIGSNWKSEIESALMKSDVAILLVSADFASSEFINENELPEFFKRKKEEGYLIMPILLRNYNFQQFEMISSLNFFKTYYRDYGFNKPTQRHELIPFDVLGEDENVTDKQLQDYFNNLANSIDDAINNSFNKAT